MGFTNRLRARIWQTLLEFGAEDGSAAATFPE